MLKLSMTLALLSCGLGACNGIVVKTPPVECSKLVPSSWAEGVPGTPIPAPVAADYGRAECAALPAAVAPYCQQAARALEEAKRMGAAFIAEGGQLDKSNGRQADTVSIYGTCEAMLNKARGAR
jgi:hypothetical protein